MFEETNMKKQIKQFGIILIVVLAVMVLLAVFRFAGVENTLTRDIKDLWGVELPDGYAVAYRAATDVTMKDGGLRYHVLSYTDDAVLENWQVTLVDIGPEKLHYHIPDGQNADRLVLYVRDISGSWVQRSFAVEGSYLIFSFTHGESGFALAQLPGEELPVSAIGIAAGAGILGHSAHW